MADKTGTEEEQKPADTPAPETETTEEKPEHHGPVEISEQQGKVPPHKSAWQWFVARRKWTIPAAVILLLAVLAAIPATRYALAGTVMKQDYKVQVVDAQTRKPVTAATVRLKGKQVSTDNQGMATVRVSVGGGELAVSKQYYTTKSSGVTVPIGKQSKPQQVQLVATGRQVPVTVVNKISGKPVADAVLSAADTEVRTDKNGEATMVLPAGTDQQKGTLTAKGYNKTDIAIRVTTEAAANTFSLTPSGKIYFLSNKTGKIDVVKTDLDGGNRQTVLAGTGKEDSNNTVMLASTDWKYLALLSKRDGGADPKLFLIDTSSDQLSVMDEGAANFTLQGWSGHRFVYQVNRYPLKDWEAKRQALKSYDAEKKALAILDESEGAGTGPYDYVRQEYGSVLLTNGELLWTKRWEVTLGNNYQLPSKPVTLNSVKADGSGKKVLHTFGTAKDVFINDTRAYDTDGMYISVYNMALQKSFYFEYEDGKVVENKSLETDFYKNYYTYLFSPSAKHTFWTEDRDGKATLFVGNDHGEDGKEVASLSEYNTYGWYTDDYLLVSKKGSELYILPANQKADQKGPTKVTDYFRPAQTFRGYGGGYGGL